MVAVGDIVEVRQFPGQRWAVLGLLEHGIPPGRLWRVRRDGAERRIVDARDVCFRVNFGNCTAPRECRRSAKTRPVG